MPAVGKHCLESVFLRLECYFEIAEECTEWQQGGERLLLSRRLSLQPFLFSVQEGLMPEVFTTSLGNT